MQAHWQQAMSEKIKTNRLKHLQKQANARQYIQARSIMGW